LGLLAVGALVDCSVCVPQFYSDPSFQLLAVAGGPYAGERLDQGGFAVVDVAYGADVDLRLARKFRNLDSPLFWSQYLGGLFL